MPVLLAAVIFGFHDFFFWVFTGSGGYLDASGVLGYAAGLGAKNTAWFVFGSAALIVLAASRVEALARRRRPLAVGRLRARSRWPRGCGSSRTTTCR